MKKIFCLTLFLLIFVSIPLMATAQVVSIPDPNLRAKVEKALGKASGATITAAEMAKLTNLKATNTRISDLTGIGVATNLTSLDLSRNRITDISPLAGLMGLKNLNLMKNRIADISPLTGLTNLKTLNLRNNRITDISPLVANTGLGRRDTVELRGNPLGNESFNTHLPALTSRAVKVHFHINIPDPNLRAAFEKALGKKRGAPISAANMAKLTSLKVKNVQISDLTGIGYATKLTYLDLGTNSITDISPLAELKKLTTLFLNYNSITDISPLTKLKKLTTLNLAFNNITDISSLTKLTKLTSLSLGDNSITDISPLTNLTKLTSLKLFINQITDISPLTKLKRLATLDLQYNSITDISPLVANTGLGSGDEVRLSQNPLSSESIDTHIPALRARGVNVNWTQSPGAPSIVLAGMSPALALKGSIVFEVSGVNRGNFRVTVKHLSNDHAPMTVAADGQGYQLNVEAGSAGNTLVISAQSPDPKVAVQPLQYTITAADVLRGWIQLPALVAYEIPTETVLLANYPNPFNPETWIPYRLAEDGFVTLTIYDQTGQVVRSLDVGHQVAGVYENREKAVYFDGRNDLGESVASGLYFYTLTAGDFSAIRKMLILK